MPTTMGVYTAAETAGTEVSSTYEGRHLTVLETELIHPNHTDDLVDKGDPVIVVLAGVTPHTTKAHAVGVALASATAATDYIAIDTEGIWNLTVHADDDSGGATGVVNPGDPLYISDDSAAAGDGTHNGIGDAVISKITNRNIQVPFGYALGQIDVSAYGVIAVKVHWDPEIPQENVGVGATPWVNAVASTRFREYYYEATGGGYPHGMHIELNISGTPALSAQALVAKVRWDNTTNFVGGYCAAGEFEVEVGGGDALIDNMYCIHLTSHIGILTLTGTMNVETAWIAIDEYAQEAGSQLLNFIRLNDTDSDYPYTTDSAKLFSTSGAMTNNHSLRILVNNVAYWIMVASVWA